MGLLEGMWLTQIYLASSGVYIPFIGGSCVLSITSVVKMDFCLESEVISNISLTQYSYFMLDHHSVNSTSMELLRLGLSLKVDK